MILLSVDGLAVRRGDRILVRDLGFDLSAGVALHLTGRNGAGKTSLLEIIAGLRPPQAGQVRHAAGLPHWLGHRNGLNPALTPVENLSYWCALNAVATAGIAAVLQQLGVDRLRHRPVRTLSTGQKRRVALAPLLLEQRPVWLLDEPLSGVDVEGVALFGELLATHLMAGGAALLTSHQALPLAPERAAELAL